MASNPGTTLRMPFAGAFGAMFGWLDNDVDRPAPPKRKPAPPAKPAPAAMPDLKILEWDEAAQDVAKEPRSGVAALDAVRRRLRDRYIAARFFGLASGAADLKRVDETIKAARLLFEDERPELALELLELAQQEAPIEIAFCLARLELLFVLRRADEFAAAARELREIDRNKAHWTEVERLGRVLAPTDPLFAGDGAKRSTDNYGPWPDLPNWIRADWDLTAEVMAADFHRAVIGAARPT